MHIRAIILCLFLFLAVDVAVFGDTTEVPSAAKAARLHALRAEWQQAIECYTQALATSPHDAVCLSRRGYAYGRIGNYQQAIADFECAIKYDANCSDAYSRRSRVYLWLGLKELAKHDAQRALTLLPDIPGEPDLLLEHASLLYCVGKSNDADDECKRVLELNSKSNELSALLIAAGAHACLRQNHDAISCLDQALLLAPDCYDLHYLRAYSYWYLGQTDQAFYDMNQYVAHNNKNPQAFFIRGDCYFQQDKFDKAVIDFGEAIKLAPNYVDSYCRRGIAYRYLRRYQEAIRDLSKAISLEPAHVAVETYEERAWAYCLTKDWKKAWQDSQQALLLNPKSASAQCTLAEAYDQLGNLAEAMEAYRKAVSLAPTESYVFLDRGLCYRAHKQYKKAIADLTQAIKYDPFDAIPYCARGAALVSDHQYEKAIADCTESLRLDPKRTHPHLSRGIAFAKLRKYAQALEDFDEAIAREPGYGEAYLQRSLVYKALGNNSKSSLDLRSAKACGYGKSDGMR